MLKVDERRQEYQETLGLNSYSDTSESLNENLQSIPLNLPFNTKRKGLEKRILDIGEHFKSQLMCGLEFDL